MRQCWMRRRHQTGSSLTRSLDRLFDAAEEGLFRLPHEIPVGRQLVVPLPTACRIHGKAV